MKVGNVCEAVTAQRTQGEKLTVVPGLGPWDRERTFTEPRGETSRSLEHQE